MDIILLYNHFSSLSNSVSEIISSYINASIKKEILSNQFRIAKENYEFYGIKRCKYYFDILNNYCIAIEELKHAEEELAKSFYKKIDEKINEFLEINIDIHQKIYIPSSDLFIFASPLIRFSEEEKKIINNYEQSNIDLNECNLKIQQIKIQLNLAKQLQNDILVIQLLHKLILLKQDIKIIESYIYKINPYILDIESKLKIFFRNQSYSMSKYLDFKNKCNQYNQYVLDKIKNIIKIIKYKEYIQYLYSTLKINNNNESIFRSINIFELLLIKLEDRMFIIEDYIIHSIIHEMRNYKIISRY